MDKNEQNDSFFVGQKCSIKKIVRENDVEKFAELTGDFNALHLNEEIAKESIFGGRVCHGMLIGSYISAVLGMYLPGEGTIYLGQDLEFKKPVYIDEEIEITVEIEKIVKEKNIIFLKTIVRKSDGNIAVNGTAKVMFNMQE